MSAQCGNPPGCFIAEFTARISIKFGTEGSTQKFTGRF
jgi:hypothetical protein